ETAPENEIEFQKSRAPALQRWGLDFREPNDRCAIAAKSTRRGCLFWPLHLLLHKGVPPLAGGTLSLPARCVVPALGAEEEGFRLAHEESLTFRMATGRGTGVMVGTIRRDPRSSRSA